MRNKILAGSIAAFLAAAAASALLLITAFPASGDAGPPRGDPAAFAIGVVGRVVSDDYSSVWGSLYPPHQDVAPRAEYVTCELQTPVGWTLRSAHVLNVVKRTRRIPGETTPRPVTLVTLRLLILNRALHTKGAFTHTFSAVADESRWTWILTPSRYRLYRDDACGGRPDAMPADP